MALLFSGMLLLDLKYRNIHNIFTLVIETFVPYVNNVYYILYEQTPEIKICSN